MEAKQAEPYDIEKDYLLRYKWYKLAKETTKSTPLDLEIPTTEQEFVSRVKQIVDYFVDFIEVHAGYKLLWDEKGTKPKSELAVQLLFNGIVHQHCIANNIDLSREVNQGRGPVDFKFSDGFQKKVLLEAKLANNTSFWHGLQKQLPFYLKADCTNYGFFLVVAYRKGDFERIKNIQEEVQKVNKDNDFHISAVVVDATYNKPSASNL